MKADQRRVRPFHYEKLRAIGELECRHRLGEAGEFVTSAESGRRGKTKEDRPERAERYHVSSLLDSKNLGHPSAQYGIRDKCR